MVSHLLPAVFLPMLCWWSCSSKIATPSALVPFFLGECGEDKKLLTHFFIKKYMELKPLWCLLNYANGIVSQWRPPKKRGMCGGGFAICVCCRGWGVEALEVKGLDSTQGLGSRKKRVKLLMPAVVNSALWMSPTSII